VFERTLTGEITMIDAAHGRPPFTNDPRYNPGSPNALLQVLILPTGNWLLIGRAKLHNNDGSNQAHSLHLRADHSDGGILDWVDNYTPGDSSMNMKVQGFIGIREWAGAIVMTCAGYKVSGDSQLASLIAVRVENFGVGYSDNPKIPATGIPPEPPQHPR
jgi:hypothetical protein